MEEIGNHGSNSRFTTKDLGRTMPDVKTLHEISSGKHASWFNYFIHADVWTADGWIITAVQDDGVTCHARKGDQVTRFTIQPNEVLYSTKQFISKLADVKNGLLPDFEPIYNVKPYILVGVKERVVLSAGDLDEIIELGDYYDDCHVETRRHDLYLNDNSKIDQPNQIAV